jgi:glucose-1-phosphate thymidylyltransferase
MIDMKAIILAAGYGTRLGQAGENLPKGLIPYKDTTLIGHVISELVNINIQEVVVVTNAKYYQQYNIWAKNQPVKINLINDHTLSSEQRLGALGDLKYAVEQAEFSGHNIMVLPSDTYFEFSLKSFLECIGKTPDEFSVIVKQMEPEFIKNRLGCAELSLDNKIVKCVEKPEIPLWPYGVMPFYYYPASIVALIDKYKAEGNSLDAPGSITPWLLKHSIPVNACVVKDKTIDVGTIKEMETLKAM